MKPFKIILVVLMVIGASVSYFSDIALVDYIGLAVEFGSAGALCASIRNKSEKKDWKVNVSMICIGISSFCLGFIGVTTDTMSQVITAVVGLLALILGLVLGKLSLPKK